MAGDQGAKEVGPYDSRAALLIGWDGCTDPLTTENGGSATSKQ